MHGFIFISVIAQGTLIQAQESRGWHDHPLVKRFHGSTIVRYEKHGLEAYSVPTGPLLKWDDTRAQPDFGGKKLNIEGEVTRITYVVRHSTSADQVFAGLKGQFAESGFEPLYEARGSELGRGLD